MLAKRFMPTHYNPLPNLYQWYIIRVVPTLGQHTFANGYNIAVGPMLGEHTFASGYIIGVGPTLDLHTFDNGYYKGWTYVGPT